MGAAPAYALALTLLVVGPLLAPGYLLLRDAVSTPRSYLSDAALGVAEAAPRSVPQDFALALASHLIDGGQVVKALLILGVWLVGVGAARLAALAVPAAGLPGQFVAITLAIWNPYVAERLVQGHWSLLVGYGCLPWVAAAMLRLRSTTPTDGAGRAASCRGTARRAPAGWADAAPLIFWIAVAGLTPTGLLLAALVALTVVFTPGAGRPRWVCAAVAAGSAVAAALPWLLAVALGSAPLTPVGPSAAGVAAFAARAEPGLGTLVSLAGLGGIWNADAVPGSRTTLFAVVATVVLLAVVAAGLPVVVRCRTAMPLLVLAAVAVLLPAVFATGAGQAVLSALIDAAPGLGVLRDGQKWVALAMPGYTLAAAGAVVTLRRRLRPPAATAAALACCLALIVVLPDLAWGVFGRVAPVHYPSGWATVAAEINADPHPVAVLPTGSMRRFDWSGAAPVLDPLPRWLRAEVLSTGDLTIAGQAVPGEGAHARRVQRLLTAGADPAVLARAGVGWLVLESGTGGDIGAAATTLDRLPITYTDSDLTLYRVGGDGPGASPAHRRAAIGAHLGWLAVLVLAGAASATACWHRRPGPVSRRSHRDATTPPT